MAQRKNSKSRSSQVQTVAPPASVIPVQTLTPKAAQSGLILLIILSVCLSLAYNAITPAATAVQHNPDENAHLLYIRSLASGHLPVFRVGGQDYEAHQPPLYYLLCTPVYALTHSMGQSTATHVVRIVSTVLGALLILVTYLTVRTLFLSDRWLALGTAGFVALLPMNVAQSASVTNDALTNLVMAVGMWQFAKLATQAQDITTQSEWIKRGVWLGLILAVGIYSKTSTLLLFPTAFLVYYGLAQQKLVSVKNAVTSCAAALGVGLLIGLPWLLRNQVLYGDPVARHIFVHAFQNTALASTMQQLFGSRPAYLGAVEQWTSASFWGGVDSMSVFWGQDPQQHTMAFYVRSSPPIIYNLLALISGISLVGLVLRLRHGESLWTPPQKVMLSNFAVLIVLTILAFLGFVLVFFQAQGRYLYPALVAFALFFVLGWRSLFVKETAFRAVVIVTTLCLFLLNLYTLLGLLWPRFHGA